MQPVQGSPARLTRASQIIGALTVALALILAMTAVMRAAGDAPGQPGTLTIAKTVEGVPGTLQAGAVFTYRIQLAHTGGTAGAKALLSDTLPVGVALAGRPRLVEEAPGVQTGGLALQGRTLMWRGGLGPDAVLSVDIPVRVQACYAPNGQPKTLTNTAVAKQEGKPAVSDSVDVAVACAPFGVGDLRLYGDFFGLDDLLTEQSDVGFYIPGEPLRVRVEVGLDEDHPEVNASSVLTHWRGPLTATFSLNFTRIQVFPGLGAAEAGNVWRGPQTTIAVTPGMTTTTVVEVTPFFGEHAVDLQNEGELEFQAEYCLGSGPCIPGEQTRTTERLRLRRFTQDLGDGPDSTNHFGLPMLAYPGVQGNFPTVFSPATGTEQGPRHVHPRPFHLGELVSWEGEADVGPDQDSINNLEPALPGGGQANLDRHDDGANPPIWTLDHCRTTLVPVRVYIDPGIVARFQAADRKGYLNLWLDGNRDGDWADSAPCDPEENLPPVALEHVVIDHPVDVVSLGGGLHTLQVPTGRVVFTDTEKPAWVRLTLSERPANKPLTTAGIDHGDGRGHSVPFLLGETEDYLWRPANAPGGIDVAVRKQGRVFQKFDPEKGEFVHRVAWVVEYGNRGDRTATGVVLRDRLGDNLNIIGVLVSLLLPDGVQRQDDGDTLVFALGDLDPGERGRILLVTEVTPSLLEATKLTNQAEIRAEGDVDTSNNVAEATVGFGPRPPRILTPVDGTTCSEQVTVTGRAVPNATVKLYVDGKFGPETTANAQGEWSAGLNLTAGSHTLYAVAEVDGVSSLPSQSVELVVDPSLLWDPISLRFVDPRGRVRQPADEDGRLDADGWTVALRPNTAYTVEVSVCCEAGAQVTLTVENLGEIALSDTDGDKTFTGSFTTGPSSPTLLEMSLSVTCGVAEASAEGHLLIANLSRKVYDLATGQPLAGAIVACLEAQSPAGFGLGNTTSGVQVRLHQTDAEGRWGPCELTPGMYYQVVISHPGYQTYRSPVWQHRANNPLKWYVPEMDSDQSGMAVALGQAGYRILITEAGFEPPVLRVPPGAIVEWVNLDTQDHSATLEPMAGMAQAGALPNWDSGALVTGESYTIQVSATGSFSYGDRLTPENSGTIVVDTAAGQSQLYLPTLQR